MAEYQSKIEDKKFHNWMKAQIAINITKQGVKEFVNEKVTGFHSTVLANTLTKEQIENKDFCTECCLENVLPCRTKRICSSQGNICSFHSVQKYRQCRKNICNKIKDEITKKHLQNSPSWSNTMPERWCDEPWKVAKCYMPHHGYCKADSFQETDLNGILSFMLKNEDVCSCISEELCTEVKDKSNKIRHSPEHLLEDEEVNFFIDKFTEFLSQKCLENDSSASEAAQKLTQLKIDNLIISSNEVAQSIAKEQELNATLRLIKEQLLSLEEKHSKELRTILAYVSGPVSKKHKSEDYQQLEQDLLQDLGTFYNRVYRNILVSPLLPGADVDILQFYVHPKMARVEWGAINAPSKVSVASYQDVLGSKEDKYTDVYISAQAGTGKTTFAKRMCIVWCLAKSVCDADAKDISEKDLETMRRFDFLFFILLRDAHERNVDAMIKTHVTDNLSRRTQYNNRFIEHILHNCRCLIILDGLDEWRPEAGSEQLPYSIPREKCTILTTTRPWKMYENDIRKSKVSNFVELTFDDKSTDLLIFKVIGDLITADEQKKTKSAGEFREMITTKHLEDLIYTPVILVQVVCLWHDEIDLGQTKCQIYSNVVEFILARGDKKHLGLQNEEYSAAETVHKPLSLVGNEFCEKYFKLLLALSKLAYNTLFKTRNNAELVFDKKVVQSAMNDTNMTECCLRMGLLSESKSSNKLAKKQLSYTFIHKTFQEYFCALFIYYLESFSEDNVRQVCRSIAEILDMSHVFIFVAGLSLEKATLISKCLIEILAKDPETEKYRSRVCTAIAWTARFKVFKDFQNMLVECVQEGEMGKGNLNKFFLQDLVIEEDCHGSYKESLKNIVDTSRDKMKSIRIYDSGESVRIHRYMTDFGLNDLDSLEKVEIIGHLSYGDMEGLISKSVRTMKCLSVCVDRRRNKNWREKFVDFSTKSVELVGKMHQLVALMLECFVISHDDLNFILTWLTGRTAMVQINLAFIKCKEHGDDCSGFKLDLSNHKKLDMLQLGNIAVSKLSLYPDSITLCRIGKLCETVLTMILDGMLQTKLLRSFMCFDSPISSDTSKILGVMPHLETLKTLVLKKIEILDEHVSQIKVPPHVKHIKLVEVKMSKAVLECLLREMNRTKEEAVRLELLDCAIGEPVQYETFKQMIKCSGRYDVWSSEESDKYGDHFMFTVKKQLYNFMS